MSIHVNYGTTELASFDLTQSGSKAARVGAPLESVFVKGQVNCIGGIMLRTIRRSTLVTSRAGVGWSRSEYGDKNRPA